MSNDIKGSDERIPLPQIALAQLNPLCSVNDHRHLEGETTLQIVQDSNESQTNVKLVKSCFRRIS